MLRSFPALFITLIFWLLSACGQQPVSDPVFVHSGSTMGTTFSVKMVPPPEIVPNFKKEPIAHGLDSLLLDINLQMSTYIENSEISRFNRLVDTAAFPVSRDFFRVMEEALRLHSFSGGALDITVGPLVNLWGFGSEKAAGSIPDQQELQARLKITGAQRLQLLTEQKALRKQVPLLQCDLSSIAKGFAVDRLGEYLEANGIHRYLVEIGGETRTRGRNQAGQKWRIGISTPDNSGQLQKILRLENHAVATSGDYHNYFEVDGKRYSHTIDPRTGRPITHTLASVTVIDANCMTADGLATAINVLGPEDGYRLALEKNLAVLLIVRSNNGFEEKMSPEFEKIFRMKE